MPFIQVCPHCRRGLRIPDHLVNQQARCLKCKQVYIVHYPQPQPQPQPPPIPVVGPPAPLTKLAQEASLVSPAPGPLIGLREKWALSIGLCAAIVVMLFPQWEKRRMGFKTDSFRQFVFDAPTDYAEAGQWVIELGRPPRMVSPDVKFRMDATQLMVEESIIVIVAAGAVFLSRVSR
jgi:hypothetical protein